MLYGADNNALNRDQRDEQRRSITSDSVAQRKSITKRTLESLGEVGIVNIRVIF